MWSCENSEFFDSPTTACGDVNQQLFEIQGVFTWKQQAVFMSHPEKQLTKISYQPVWRLNCLSDQGRLEDTLSIEIGQMDEDIWI